MPIRPAAALACAWLALAGCAGDRPVPARAADPELPMARAPEAENGQGNLSFHYSNKSTDANLAIDLSSTDVYLEMTGKAAQEQVERMRPREAGPRPEPAARKPAASAPASKADAAPEAAEPDGNGEEAAGEAQAARGQDPDQAKPAKGLHKAPPRKPEPPPEEEPAGYEDVTAKVLAGIRRAQELFYQKRYAEAMQAVRSSQDARPTAEGYALQGSIHFMQGQTGMARRQWMEALRLNPDMPAVVNMLERTRTPGGRGSPSPRPVYRPPARPAEPEAPYPEEGSVPAPDPVPSGAAAEPTAPPAPRAARPRPAPDMPASGAAAAPAPSAAPASAAADTPVAPPAQAEEETDEEAASEAPAPAAPAVPAAHAGAAPAKAAPPPSAAVQPPAKPAAKPAAKAAAKAADHAAAEAPAKEKDGTAKAAPKAAPATAPARDGKR